jgi:hypothetical protein
VSGNWTVSSSLIRNLPKVFWIGTPRVIEEDRNPPAAPETGREKQGTGKNREQGKGNREQVEVESTRD